MGSRERITRFLAESPNVVYTVWLEMGDKLACKIGHSSNFFARMNQISSGIPGTPCYYHLLSTPSKEEAHRREAFMQAAMKPFRKQGEWFNSGHGQALVGAWCCAVGLVRVIAFSEQTGGMSLSGFVRDWGYYGEHPNPTAEMIRTVTRAYRLPFDDREWRKMEAEFGYTTLPEEESA